MEKPYNFRVMRCSDASWDTLILHSMKHPSSPQMRCWGIFKCSSCSTASLPTVFVASKSKLSFKILFFSTGHEFALHNRTFSLPEASGSLWTSKQSSCHIDVMPRFSSTFSCPERKLFWRIFRCC